MSEIAERLVAAMKNANMTQADLHRKTGFTRAAISKWVNGQSEPKDILTLARILGVTPEWLQTGKEARNRVDMQISPVMSLDDATPEDLARIILAYEQSSDLKKLALQKLSELPEDKLNAILSLIG